MDQSDLSVNILRLNKSDFPQDGVLTSKNTMLQAPSAAKENQNVQPSSLLSSFNTNHQFDQHQPLLHGTCKKTSILSILAENQTTNYAFGRPAFSNKLNQKPVLADRGNPSDDLFTASTEGFALSREQSLEISEGDLDFSDIENIDLNFDIRPSFEVHWAHLLFISYLTLGFY